MSGGYWAQASLRTRLPRRSREHHRGCNPSTLRDYRSTIEAHLLPGFGSIELEAITPAAIDAWCGLLTGLSIRIKQAPGRARRDHAPGAAPVGLHSNPVRGAGSEQDAAIYLTAAFTGVRRGELLALHRRDIDFAGSTIRVRASCTAGEGHLSAWSVCLWSVPPV